MHAIVGDLDRVVLAHLMRHAIRRIQSGTRSGHQRHSATQKRAIKTHSEWCNQWQSEVAISGNQWQSDVAISGNQWQSHSEWCNQRQSVALRGNQRWQSVAITLRVVQHSEWPSEAISGTQK